MGTGPLDAPQGRAVLASAAKPLAQAHQTVLAVAGSSRLALEGRMVAPPLADTACPFAWAHRAQLACTAALLASQDTVALAGMGQPVASEGIELQEDTMRARSGQNQTSGAVECGNEACPAAAGAWNVLPTVARPGTSGLPSTLPSCLLRWFGRGSSVAGKIVCRDALHPKSCDQILRAR